MTYTEMLPFLPISPALLLDAPFFLSKDSRIVRAGFWMLDAAWRSRQPGSIPGNFEALALITRLAESEVADHYEVLTEGWELSSEDGRLHCQYLQLIAESVQERFGAELAVFADSAALASQGGEAQFQLVPSVEIVKKKRGMQVLPKDFQIDRITLEYAVSEGYSEDVHRTWLLQQFQDYARSNALRQADWQAAMRKFLANNFTRDKFASRFGHFPGQVVAPAPIRSARARLHAASSGPLSFAQQTTTRNSDLMASALSRAAERSA